MLFACPELLVYVFILIGCFFFQEKGNCPLHIAANAGQLLQVELLCVHGADPSLLDSEGKAPLDYAM